MILHTYILYIFAFYDKDHIINAIFQKKDQRPGLNQVTNQDQPLMKFGTAEDAQVV